MTNTNWADMVAGVTVCADPRPTGYGYGGHVNFQIQGVVVKVFPNGAVMLRGVRDERDPFGVYSQRTGYFVLRPGYYGVRVLGTYGDGGVADAWGQWEE